MKEHTPTHRKSDTTVQEKKRVHAHYSKVNPAEALMSSVPPCHPIHEAPFFLRVL